MNLNFTIRDEMITEAARSLRRKMADLVDYQERLVFIPKGLIVTTAAEHERLAELRFHARSWMRERGIIGSHRRPFDHTEINTPAFLSLQAD